MNFIEFGLHGMTHGGSAIGRYAGRAVFVPYGIPGEQIRARIVQDKRRFATAEIIELIEISPSRVVPRCKHFQLCGGCHWQHIAYPNQLEFKRQIVIDQLKRIGGFSDVQVHSTRPSSDSWQYRSHVTFHLTQNGVPGFIGTDDHTLVSISECHIMRPELMDYMRRNMIEGNKIRVQIGGEDEVIAFSIRPDEGVIGDSRGVFYTIKNRRFWCSAGSFFQVNVPQAEVLVELVLEFLILKGDERILDLYSGVGLFTAFLAERAGQVTAVEVSSRAVQDARQNLASLDNVVVLEGKVQDVLAHLSGKYDCVVLDPPRTGMDGAALKALICLEPTKIVYVSCDPATFARDAKHLAANNYNLVEVHPVDMFPQTYHIECVALFVRQHHTQE